MTLQEIKELKDMGFSTDQIMSLSGVQAPAPDPDKPEPDTPAPAPDPDEPEPDTPSPAPDPRLEELEQTVKSQASQLEELRKQLQAENRQKLSMDHPPDDLDNRVDQVMAELIRPTIQKKGG